MLVAALGTSLLKGAAQQHPDRLVVGAGGPQDDRRFCFVDPLARRVLRTVENPALLALQARLDVAASAGGPDVLRVRVPGHAEVAAAVVVSGRTVADYWGRRTDLELVAGPLDDLVSAHLGREAVLAQARPGQVVYGGAVTVVTTSSLRELARRAGRDPGTGPQRAQHAVVAAAEPFRANVVVGSGDAAPFVEDGWAGALLQTGDVVLQVEGPVPRCAVVRLRPGSGARRDVDPLALLAGDRRVAGEVVFGVQARVVRTGTVRLGDAVAIGWDTVRIG